MEEYFTKIPNRILEGFASGGLTKNEYRIVLLLFRTIYGCHRKVAKIILRDFTATGISESLVRDSVASLTKKGFINWNPIDKTISFNEDNIKKYSLDEERFQEILRKNLKKPKERVSEKQKEKLKESLSRGDYLKSM